MCVCVCVCVHVRKVVRILEPTGYNCVSYVQISITYFNRVHVHVVTVHCSYMHVHVCTAFEPRP